MSSRAARMAALLTAVAMPLVAQQPSPSAAFIDVGSERERVLRVLQVGGDAPLYPWSARALSPREADRLAPSGAARVLMPETPPVRSRDALWISVLPMEAGAIYNTSFPFGYNDGPVWAGKGLTASLAGGVAARYGPLSLQLEPIVFATQNASYPLLVNAAAATPFADGFHPREIDQPQRFGNGSYRRFDLGQSTLRLDVGPVAAELSTANQWWGPAIEFPLILGNNAPGFLHATLGTARPLNIFIGRLYGRLVWGRLEQSDFAPPEASDTISTSRFMAGIAAVFIPRGIDGLELGFSRFFHSRWPRGGLRDAPFGRPIETLFRQSGPAATSGNDAGNQLAAVFGRWVFPKAGVEVYGEYGRDDYNGDLRDFWLEPDHIAAYSVGIQRVWNRSADSRVAFRGELLNSRLSHLNQARPQAPWYVHAAQTEGHTVRGQVLASPAGYGGGGSVLAVDSYRPGGRWTFEWNRLMRSETSLTSRLTTVRTATADVMHAFTVERRRDSGRISLLTAGTVVGDFNRDFAKDRFNLALRSSVRASF